MDILMFNVESGDELTALDKSAREMHAKARIALRVNPDIDPGTHPYISTGLKENKFGISIDRALEYYQTAKALPNVEVVGVHQHIGSQITEVRPFVDALEKLVGFVKELKDAGINIRYINIGGGLGITYKDETPPHPRELAQAIRPILKDCGCTLVLEPGRAIVGNAGILVTRVVYQKEGGNKKFVIVDAGMNDLLRPSLYEAYHEIKPVIEPSSAASDVVDVVGPICESGDFLAKDRELPKVKQGECLAVMGAGAYGFSMSSTYNSRPRVAEVMVKGNDYFVVREREVYNDLVRGEKLPRWLD
jgi:diaminopimelate decarboxylase